MHQLGVSEEDQLVSRMASQGVEEDVPTLHGYWRFLRLLRWRGGAVVGWADMFWRGGATATLQPYQQDPSWHPPTRSARKSLLSCTETTLTMMHTWYPSWPNLSFGCMISYFCRKSNLTSISHLIMQHTGQVPRQTPIYKFMAAPIKLPLGRLNAMIHVTTETT